MVILERKDRMYNVRLRYMDLVFYIGLVSSQNHTLTVVNVIEIILYTF